MMKSKKALTTLIDQVKPAKRSKPSDFSSEFLNERVVIVLPKY